MLNFNGQLINSDELQLSSQNRGFKYGDAIFETLNIQNNKVVFWEDHYFRLMASMRMLRMEIPMEFTLEFLEQEILKTVHTQEHFSNVRVRLTVFRKDGGLYTPKTNEIDYLIMTKSYTKLKHQVKSSRYYIFWGAATVAVMAGQIYVGTGYNSMSQSVEDLTEVITIKIELEELRDQYEFRNGYKEKMPIIQ